ncbi:kinesin heavy chain, putative [Perkinsus marinus ATCC 50983]|uniref:Kinesin-like protein n=1 Tax=Perkinsus marinus (strain ATCC 50983 / TXsc) TaxID=423536 RepID=C5KB56_PERM5|nr:kinesin heavy chain, putative [Perkinsus marinus ATCC 50983]EER18382.1 kinesin heavy chain, putative [Perkinsus marinus ATCC 50983]|eukprot:XP_002786586.1 kinesin heavy chain, putative [Perkinsus marinus ATCC 50983]
MEELVGQESTRRLKENNQRLAVDNAWHALEGKGQLASEVASVVSSSVLQQCCPACLLEDEKRHEIVAAMREKVALIGAEREGEPSSQVEGCCREWMKAGHADVPSLVSSLGQACRDVVTCDDRVCEGLKSIMKERDALRELTRNLRNEIQDLRGGLRVFCRIRPPRTGQKEESLELLELDVSTCGTRIVVPDSRRTEYNFDFVFPPSSTQEDVFAEVSPVMEALTSNIQAQLADGTTSPLRQQNRMRGGCTNLCIFAYGQTGTGKTHTLEGGTTEADRGLIPRALELLFAEVDRLNNSMKRATADRRLSIALCVVEVYNENVRDLLSGGSSDNRLEVHTASSLESAHALLKKARANRAVGQNRLNPRSSRSHLIVTAAVVLSPPQRIVGRVWFVDLAGSERLKTSGDWTNVGTPLKRASTAGNLDQFLSAAKSESSYINQSLTSLGNVLSGLRESSDCEDDRAQPYIPYRGSKLTFLLQGALGDKASKVLMFSTLSSNLSDQSETLSTLNYAGRAATSVRSSCNRKSTTSKCSTTPGLNDSNLYGFGWKFSCFYVFYRTSGLVRKMSFEVD